MYSFLESKTIVGDIANVLLGKQIASGSSREVFVCRMDKTFVVKVEERAGSFQNIREHQIWEEVVYADKIAQWFAPCEYISPCGTVLIQKRVEPAYKKDFPDKMPQCFTDRQYANFGMLDGKLVCCDYGSWLQVNGFSSRMIKANWHDEV